MRERHIAGCLVSPCCSCAHVMGPTEVCHKNASIGTKNGVVQVQDDRGRAAQSEFARSVYIVGGGYAALHYSNI